MNHKDTHDLNNGMVAWPKDADTSPKDPNQFAFDSGNDDSTVIYAVGYDEVLNYPKINIISSAVSVEDACKRAEDECGQAFPGAKAFVKAEGGPEIQQKVKELFDAEYSKLSESMPDTTITVFGHYEGDE